MRTGILGGIGDIPYLRTEVGVEGLKGWTYRFSYSGDYDSLIRYSSFYLTCTTWSPFTILYGSRFEH